MTTEHETPLIRAVDDDEDQLISLEALLSGEGWDVAAYTSARDFFVNDRPSRPGCLILDLRMPDVSGLEVQAEMKKIETCIECGICKTRCPYELDIPTLLKKNYADYQKVLAGEVKV